MLLIFLFVCVLGLNKFIMFELRSPILIYGGGAVLFLGLGLLKYSFITLFPFYKVIDFLVYCRFDLLVD